MKEVEFSGELPDMEALKAALFGDPTDPKSPNYVRQLERPDINWLLVAAGIILPLLAAFAVAFFMSLAKVRLIYCILAVVAVLALCGILLARRAVITAVKIYQRFAPKSIMFAVYDFGHREIRSYPRSYEGDRPPSPLQRSRRRIRYAVKKKTPEREFFCCSFSFVVVVCKEY